MKETISTSTLGKVTVAIIILIIITGFMIKLPRSFRNYDKELHTLFYFYVSFGFNLIYAKDRGFYFLLGVFGLIAFGVGIELAQEASNQFFRKKIHGNFDIKDIQYNLLGIGLYSTIFIAHYIYNKVNINTLIPKL